MTKEIKWITPYLRIKSLLSQKYSLLDVENNVRMTKGGITTKMSIPFLVKNYKAGHTMLLEQIPIYLECVAPISLTRELRTYRHTSPLEKSTRASINNDFIELCDYGIKDRDREVVEASIYSTFYLVDKLDFTADQKRDLLPLLTASKIVMILNLHELLHILNQRYYAKTGKPDPRFVKLFAEALEDLEVQEPEIYNIIKELEE